MSSVLLQSGTTCILLRYDLTHASLITSMAEVPEYFAGIDAEHSLVARLRARKDRLCERAGILCRIGDEQHGQGR